MNIIIIEEASAFLADAPFFVYDRIMNLYKHFCKGLDSRAKTVIMVLALRKMEC